MSFIGQIYDLAWKMSGSARPPAQFDVNRKLYDVDKKLIGFLRKFDEKIIRKCMSFM